MANDSLSESMAPTDSPPRRPNNVFMLKPDVDFGDLYEALTDRLSRIESMAAARVGENEGENPYWCAIGAQANEGQEILDKLHEIHWKALEGMDNGHSSSGLKEGKHED